MGQLVLTTLSDGTNTTSITNTIRGAAKAWAFWDGTFTTVPIHASYNVSSIIRNNTGQYRISFINNFPDGNYAALVCGDRGSPSRWGGTGEYYFARSASQLQTLCTDYTSSDPDNAYMSVVCFR